MQKCKSRGWDLCETKVMSCQGIDALQYKGLVSCNQGQTDIQEILLACLSLSSTDINDMDTFAYLLTLFLPLVTTVTFGHS